MKNPIEGLCRLHMLIASFLSLGFGINLPNIVSGENLHNMIKKIPFGFHDIFSRHIAYIFHGIVKVPWLLARKTIKNVFGPLKGESVLGV